MTTETDLSTHRLIRKHKAKGKNNSVWHVLSGIMDTYCGKRMLSPDRADPTAGAYRICAQCRKALNAAQDEMNDLADAADESYTKWDREARGMA